MKTNIEETVLDALHEAIPNTNFTIDATMKFIDPTVGQFISFKRQIEERLNINISKLKFYKWKTVKDIINDIEREVK